MQYQYNKTDGGPGSITDLDTGNSIPLDADNPDFCHALDWAAQQSPIPTHFNTRPGARHFCTGTLRKLTECCISEGIMLYARPVTTSVDREEEPKMELPTSDILPFERGRFGQLARVRADSAGSRHETSEGIDSEPSGIWVSDKLLRILEEHLASEDEQVRRLSSWPIRRSFVYLDISDFSKYKAGQQALVIQSLSSLTTRRDRWVENYTEEHAFEAIEARLCIGDGYIYCFKDSIFATYFAARLARKVEEAVARHSLPVEFHFRASVHVGHVFCFWDHGRKDWNYTGDGINGGSRVLEAIGKEVDDVLFISNDVREDIIAEDRQFPFLPKLLQALQNRGRRSDKHGNVWRVYELNHMSID